MNSNVIFYHLAQYSASVEQTNLGVAFASEMAGVSYPLAIEPKEPWTERQIKHGREKNRWLLRTLDIPKQSLQRRE